MIYKNNVMYVRHALLTKLVKLWKDGELVDKIDWLPIELSPKRGKVVGRCCTHKERAVWRYKTFPLMGFDMSDEENELMPLSKLASRCLSEKPKKDNLMCVVDEACSSCVQINYEITNLCRGCVARNCYMNCPKEAIHFNSKGKAEIDHDKCISCGKCYNSCQYHAIVYMPVPCEEACPVKAISKDEYGVEHIDESKCIYCGKCLTACPFGAIFEISHALQLLQRMREGEKMVAIVAPAILSQFQTEPERVFGALKEIGFADVIEVAQGAAVTTAHESAELEEKLEEGQPFMTTSCCPSYIQLVKKHIPKMEKYVSSTKSPMYYTAEIAKQKHPDAKIIFLGPCIAKRKEARMNGNVDDVITFEELGSIFEGFGIIFDEIPPFFVDVKSDSFSQGYAQNGGVFAAVKHALKSREPKNPLLLAGMNKKTVALLKAYAQTGKCPSEFIEVMVCENGCISGPANRRGKSESKKLYEGEMKKIRETEAAEETANTEKAETSKE